MFTNIVAAASHSEYSCEQKTAKCALYVVAQIAICSKCCHYKLRVNQELPVDYSLHYTYTQGIESKLKSNDIYVQHTIKQFNKSWLTYQIRQTQEEMSLRL